MALQTPVCMHNGVMIMREGHEYYPQNLPDVRRLSAEQIIKWIDKNWWTPFSGFFDLKANGATMTILSEYLTFYRPN